MEDIKTLENKTISGLFWKYLERMGAQIISFIVSIILARILDPEHYGTISIVTIFISLANILVTSGIGNSLIQTKRIHKIDYYTMFSASFILSILFYIVLFFLAPTISHIYNNSELISVIRAMGLILILSSLTTVQHAYVSRNMIFKKFFYATLIGTIIGAIVGITMAYCGFGVWALVTQTMVKSIMDVFVLCYTIDLKLKFCFSKKSFKRLFSYGFKYMLTSFIGGFFNYLKGFIIGLKYSSTDLAFSTKGEQIPSVAVNNLYSAIESVLFSTVSRLNSEPERIKAFVKNVLSILTFCIMPLMFGVIACADNIVAVLYTDKWAPIVPYLRILSFQYAFSIVGTLNLLIINARGRSDISLKLEIIKKPVYVLFIFIGMMFGPLYIILANALYTVFGIIINTIPNKKLVNYGLLEQVKDIMPNIISALIMMIVTMLIGRLEMNNTIVLLLLQVILGAIVYVSLQILLKNDNIKIIVSFLKKIAFKYILKKGNKSAS